MTDYIQTKTRDGHTIRIEVESVAKAAAGFGGRQTSPADVSTEAVDNVFEQVLDMGVDSRELALGDLF